MKQVVISGNNKGRIASLHDLTKAQSASPSLCAFVDLTSSLLSKTARLKTNEVKSLIRAYLVRDTVIYSNYPTKYHKNTAKMLGKL